MEEAKANAKSSPATQVAKAIGECVAFVAVCGIAVFVPARTLRFWNAWLLVGTCFGAGVVIMIRTALKSPQLA